MKTSNLAWRMEPFEQPREAQPAKPEGQLTEAPQRVRARPRFDRRTIEIRDQGFVPFRIR